MQSGAHTSNMRRDHRAAQASGRATRPENRLKTGQFAKGHTGNPGGRPVKTEEEFALEHACRLEAQGALETVKSLMVSAAMEKVRLGAAVFILERAYGKALQRTETTQTPLESAATNMLIGMLTHLQEKQARLMSP